MTKWAKISDTMWSLYDSGIILILTCNELKEYILMDNTRHPKVLLVGTSREAKRFAREYIRKSKTKKWGHTIRQNC